MRKILMGLLVLLSSTVFAQQQAKQFRILILLDGSSSMLELWSDSTSRFKVASQVITTLIDSVYSVNPDVEFALRVYGHQHPAQENNCFDTRLEVMFSKNNLTQIGLRLAALHPAGITPVAFSLKEAAENDFVNPDKYNYTIVLITDGGESCGGKICEVALDLWKKKINFKPYIISLVQSEPMKLEFTCLGNYLSVPQQPEITPAIETIMNGYRVMINTTQPTKQITAERKPIQPFPTQNIKGLVANSNVKPLPVQIKPIIPVKTKTIQPKIESDKGYVLFINPPAKGTIILYRNLGTGYKEIDQFEISTKRVELTPGKYKAVLNNTAKEFIIKQDMITEVR